MNFQQDLLISCMDLSETFFNGLISNGKFQLTVTSGA